MKKVTLILLAIILLQSCKAQSLQADLPKIENYTKGELEIKILSFGMDNPITVGKVTADGIIHFNWPELDLSKMNTYSYFTTSMNRFIGSKFCNDPNAVVSSENEKLVEVKYLYLFKYGQSVGVILPSTQKGQEHREDQLGGTINWMYSDSDTRAKANCIKRREWEGSYSFDETIGYDLTFKRGWNLVSYTLKEIETWENDTQKGSLPKAKIIESLAQIPTNIHWYLNYTANDEYLEIEQKLLKTPAITKLQYENWLPKNLGNIKRTHYEIGEKIERVPTTNNIHLLFEKDSKTIDVIIVDCADNKEAGDMYTLILDMASSDWNDKTKTGYRSASKIESTRVLTVYNEKEVKTVLNYNVDDRFLVKAEAVNIKAQELWEILKGLHLETLVNE